MPRNLYLCGLFIAVLTFTLLWSGKTQGYAVLLIMALQVFFKMGK